MESIGNKLKSARESKDLSIEQAVRDTHITKRFIEAMEAEDFDQFPGEAYLLGFLRNYASYLGLEGEEIVTLYHNLRLQEQPAPIDELLDRKRRRPPPVGLIILFLAVLLVGGIVALFVTGVISLPRRGEATTDGSVRAENAVAPIVLDEQFVERRFAVGERVAVPIDEEEVLLEFLEISERVALGSEGGIVHIDNGERRLVDLTGEGGGDVTIAVRQIYPASDGEAASAVVRIDRVLDQGSQEAPPAGEISESRRIDLALGQTNQPSRRRDAIVVGQFPEIEDYLLEIDFRGTTLFRWEIDEEPRVERMVQNGESLSVRVNEIARLWISNAGNTRIEIAGTPVELGGQGEIATAVVHWNDAASGQYQLEVLPLY